MITELKENEIFVFGSNESGIHGGGAARQALKEFGAVYGVGFGHTGSCFAIPTKDWDIETLPIPVIAHYVSRFIDYAKKNQAYKFLVTEIGCGLAGYKVENIAPLFKSALDIPNIILPESFVEFHKPKMKQVTYIDPPAGWKYGFPKVLPADVIEVKAWLIENGYPEKKCYPEMPVGMFVKEYPINAKEFNKFWAKHLAVDFAGLSIDEEKIIEFLHDRFLLFKTKFPNFKYEQIKYKFDSIRAYVSGITGEEFMKLYREINEVNDKIQSE